MFRPGRRRLSLVFWTALVLTARVLGRSGPLPQSVEGRDWVSLSVTGCHRLAAASVAWAMALVFLASSLRRIVIRGGAALAG